MISNSPVIECILQDIAKHYPYSPSDIKASYEMLESIDETIRACELAIVKAVDDIIQVAWLLKKTKEGVFGTPKDTTQFIEVDYKTFSIDFDREGNISEIEDITMLWAKGRVGAIPK